MPSFCLCSALSPEEVVNEHQCGLPSTDTPMSMPIAEREMLRELRARKTSGKDAYVS